MKGFTLFYALLVSSLALAIGASIYDITVREIQLSSTVAQSQYAVYVADTGAECALYWDNKCSAGACNSAASAFATSTSSKVIPTSSSFACSGVDISNPAGTTLWTVTTSANAATTTFYLQQLSVRNQQPCAYVQVAKVGNPSQTTVTSHGYSDCSTGTQKIERVFQVSY